MGKCNTIPLPIQLRLIVSLFTYLIIESSIHSSSHISNSPVATRKSRIPRRRLLGRNRRLAPKIGNLPQKSENTCIFGAKPVNCGNTYSHVGDRRSRVSRKQDLGLEMRQMTDRQMIAAFGIVMVVVGILIIGAGLFGDISVSVLVFGAIPTIIGTLVLVRR